MSLPPPFTLDVSEDFLPPQDLLPHSAPSIDTDKIAPWLTASPPLLEHEGEPMPPTPPAKTPMFPFLAHKSSFSTFGASTTSLRSSRTSDTYTFDSSAASTHNSESILLRPQDARKPKSSSVGVSGVFAKIIPRRSRSKLRPTNLRVDSSSPDVPPLPSPDYIPFRQTPPSPPSLSANSSTSSKKTVVVRGKKKSNAPPPPPIPPKDGGPEIRLDTDLDKMDGIINLNILPQQNNLGTEASSPSSMLGSSDHSTGLSSDVSSLGHPPPYPIAGSSQQSSLIFNDPFRPSNGKRKYGATVVALDKISPTTRPPIYSNIPITSVLQQQQQQQQQQQPQEDPAWFPPDSWAVQKEGGDGDQGIGGDSSSDESAVGRTTSHLGNGATTTTTTTTAGSRRKRRRHTSARESKSTMMLKGPGSGMFRIRIYRTNNTHHVVQVRPGVTVADLTPALNKKLLLDPEAEVHKLYLKERGRERILAPTEKPADIVRRRLEQAGYDPADGLDMLGGEDIQFLMKFVYKSNVLGPVEDELIFDNFEYIDLVGRGLKAVPVVLYPHAEGIVSLNLSRNPMLELPLDFIQACTTLRELRLSNMAMKRIPQSIRHCACLHRLDLSCNRIADLEEAHLDSILGLRFLKIQNNRLEELPWYLPRLHQLRELNISNNKFRKLPDVVPKITSLIDLDVSFNTIQELPEELGNLRQLERLILVGNQVTRFPYGCSKLERLRELDCRRNNISDLSVMCMLPSVESILADHNSLSALDVSVGGSLGHLDASHNDITQLTISPGPVGQPYGLVSLDISYAKLSALDEKVLSHLTSLQVLKICHNAIRTLPDSLTELSQLQHLSVSNNQLYALPATIGRLQKLEKLEAHNNSLSELPVSLWECASLTLINLTSNLLSSFHDPDPSNVRPPLASSLERLYLGENHLSEDVLHPLTLFRDLKVLNLSFNNLQDLPPPLFRNMRGLEELYLSGNKLSALPMDDLHSLAKLRILYLNGNRFRTLPREMSQLVSLAILDVGSNNLKYNISNIEYDWNWNFHPHLRYLNLSGNKRLEIKPPAQNLPTARPLSDRRELRDPAGFSELTQLRVLGLMDVTTLSLPTVPDDNEERRVRTSLSEINKMAYGIADTLGGNLNMFDLVQPAFRGRADEAIVAMFGRSSHVGSHNRVSKYLHDHFIGVFAKELDEMHPERGETPHDALRRSFLKLNKYLHDYLYGRDTRKPSTVSASGSIHQGVDASCVRSGASGIVLYFTEGTVYVANVGNSLAVMSSQGTAQLLSKKHDPFDRLETARIRSAEGWVSPKGFVNDEIDVSRAFGFYYLLPVLNARPDVFEQKLTEVDEFVIVANSGLWDHVTYQTAIDIARSETDPMMAAQKLRDFAISYGAEGTTMIMVISVADLFPNSGRSRGPTADISSELKRPRLKGGEIINRDISRLDDEVSPPTGHVAIVFTDIRNSTHLWEVNAGMPTAILQHNLLLRRQLRFCGGYEVKTEGDAFMCSFPTTLAGLWWCLSVQEELLKVDWPSEILECEDGKAIYDTQKRLIARGLSVRMGIHHGKPVCDLDPTTHRMDYFGPMVNRSARINSCANGGQIMCSAEVMREINARIFETGPPTEHSHYQPQQAVEAIRRMGLHLIPVGEIKLKGLEIPENMTSLYPMSLAGRNELEAAGTEDPSAAGSRVQFSVQQMKELAVLCVRLEMLTSGRVFRPLPGRKPSNPNHHPSQPQSQQTSGDGNGDGDGDGGGGGGGEVEVSNNTNEDGEEGEGEEDPNDVEEEEEEDSNSLYLYGNVDALVPSMDKATDADLTLLLDSLSLRIENALAALTIRQIMAMNKRREPEDGFSSRRRNGGAMDVRVLQQLLTLLQTTAGS